MFKYLLILIFLASKSLAFEDVGDKRITHYDPILTLTVGTSMFITPIASQSKQFPVMSGWEHGAFGFAWTKLGFDFLPKDINWLSPIILTAIFSAYYIDQLDHARNNADRDLTWRKFGNSELGIVGATILEF